MYQSYDDIISRIGLPILWYDEHAVPRFCKFVPSKVANIHADEVALLEIECQVCHKHYFVALSWDHSKELIKGYRPLSYWMSGSGLSWGDPPNSGHNSQLNCSGATMSCNEIRVAEFWIRSHGTRDWYRDSSLEKQLDSEYVDSQNGSEKLAMATPEIISKNSNGEWFKSIDGGTGWTRIEVSVPAIPEIKVAVNEEWLEYTKPMFGTEDLEDDFRLFFESCIELMKKKNAKYGNAWNEERPESITDRIRSKSKRIVTLENNRRRNIPLADGEEGIIAELMDIANYCVFRSMKQEEFEHSFDQEQP